MMSGLVALSISAVLAALIATSTSHAPQVKGFSPEDVLRRLTTSYDQSTPREQVMERLAFEQEKKLASQTHFISEIILSHQRSRFSTNQARQMAATIALESTRLGFDPFFVASVIKYESTFNPGARSHAGAVGLMQVMPATGHFISKNAGYNLGSAADLRDPLLNVKLGILYLAYLRKEFRNNKEQMLIAYNWGPENYRKALRSGRNAPASTVHYARRVIAHFREWQKSFDSLSSRYRHFDFKRAAIEPADKKHVG